MTTATHNSPAPTPTGMAAARSVFAYYWYLFPTAIVPLRS